MTERQKFATNSPWESIIGYSRAIRIGNTIEVTGTVATDGTNTIGIGDPYEQTKYIFEKIEGVLKQAGATLDHVVRTRIFTTDISQWEAIGKAHGEFFAEIRPCTTMVEVSKLIGDEYLVEIEVTAVL